MPIKNFSRWLSRKLLSVLFILAISPASLVTASASRQLPVSAYLYLGLLPISSQSQSSPRLLTQNNSTRAVALNANTFLAEPFSLSQLITFGTDPRTRLVLFATNIDVPVGENPPALTADSEDSNHTVYPLQVEYVDRLGVSEPTYAIHVRLNDAMVEAGDVLVRLYFNGVPSNRVRVGLGHVGGGLPDDGASQITQLSPTSITAGGNPLTLSISGSGFTPDAKPFFNGIQHTATVASENLMLVPLSASEVQTAVTYSVHVQTIAGASNSVSFSVNNPQPEVTGLSPSNVINGGSGFTLGISGSGFVQGSVVNFNGSSRVTTFVSATLLMAQILASDVTGAGSFPVTVVNAAPGGGTSPAVSLVVAAPAPTPTPLPSPTATPSPAPTPSGAISYPTAIQNLSLLPSKTAYYRFTEISGSAVSDSSGGGHTGTASGAVVLNRPSLVTGDANHSALFDGGRLTSPSFMPALSSGLTLACLFQPTGWSASSRYSIVATGNGGAGGYFQLYYQDGANVFSYAFADTTGAHVAMTFPVLKGTRQLNRTYHVAVTHDFASKTVKMYLDGLLVSKQTYTSTPKTGINQRVTIGNDNVHGYVDEALAAGDRVLSESEIRSLMRASVGAAQSATEFYVSLTGTYRASGSIGNPIDLYTAFRSGLAAPGQTYWLRGGTYNAPHITPTEAFYVYAIGTAGNPIRYKEHSGERVVIDGVNLDLGSSTYGQLAGAFTGQGVVNIMSPGAYVELWGVEVTNSNADAAANRAHWRPIGINVSAPHVKLIGVWVYDNDTGIFPGVAATDFEAHGCLIFDNGEYFTSSPGGAAIEQPCNCRPAGHAMYLENADTVNRKLIKNTVMWGNANYGFHAFGTGAQASGMDADGVVSFMNGVWTQTTSATPAIAFVSLKPMRENTIKNSVAYTKTGITGANYALGRGGDPHEYLTVTNNKSFGYGSDYFVDLAHVNYSNNLVIDTRPSAQGANNNHFTYIRPLDYSGYTGPQYSLDHAYSYLGLKGSWAGTGNTYAGSGYSTSKVLWNEDGVSNYNLASWQSVSNIDSDATIRDTDTRPYTSPLIYYFPNTYESGKGFIAVYNPPGDATASIDLSRFGIVVGQSYTIRDVMNPFVDLATGTYSGSSISISMSGTTVRAPIGYTIAGAAASRTSREFKTFVVIPGV